MSLRGLTRTFGELTAVDGLTLDIERGELFGIVGPDGAGKTTTLRMLAGVLRPSAGEAFVEGVEVGADPEAVKSHIAYMAQRFGLYDDLTVQENLDFYADLYSVPRPERPARLERLYRFAQSECDADEKGLEAAQRFDLGPKALAELEEQVFAARQAMAKAKKALVALQSHDPA